MPLTPKMLEPVETLARFIASGDDRDLGHAFGEAVTVVENFAPFLFEGTDAFAKWRAGFRGHVEADALGELRWSFGQPQDFSREGDLVYFVLPTTWTGKAHGRPFSEDGGWAFVLEEVQGGWRIRSYAWAVTAKR